METNGQEICRLELNNSQTRLMHLKFNAYTTLAFPLKLLLLASAVRLAAFLTSSKRPKNRLKPTPKNFLMNEINGHVSSPLNLTQLSIETHYPNNTNYVSASKSCCTIA